jgi:rRNA maturation protein Rpf1
LILLTTSRRPTPRIRTFCRDLTSAFPNITRVNRGKMSLDALAEKAIELNCDQVIVIGRWHGAPGKIGLYKVSLGLTAVSPLMIIQSIRLRRELNQSSRINSSLITLEPASSPELHRLAGCLSRFFGLPILSLHEVTDNHRVAMHLSYDSSRRVKMTFTLLERMVEIGPQVTFSRLIWDVSA